MNLLLWGAETWSLRKLHLDKLEVFLHRSIRRILQISMSTVQEQRLRNGKVRDMFYSIPCVRNMIAARQMDFVGKMIRGLRERSIFGFGCSCWHSNGHNAGTVCRHHVHAQRATHRHHSHTPKIISSIPSRWTMHDQLF